MAGSCIAAVMEHLPKAALVFDRFHVVTLKNQKQSDLRREMYHELTDKLHRQVLKGTRWLLVMNPVNLKQNEKGDKRARLREADCEPHVMSTDCWCSLWIRPDAGLLIALSRKENNEI